MPEAPKELEGQEQPVSVEDVQSHLKRDIMVITSTVAEMLYQELAKALTSKDVQFYIPYNISAYLYAAGVLALSGKDISKGGMKKLLEAVGITPYEGMMEAVAGLHYKNHIVYIVAMFYLLHNKMEVTADNLIKITNAMDIYPDVDIAEEVIVIYQTQISKLLVQEKK